MKYFKISSIIEAIEHLQQFNGNWLLPAFVFASNEVSTTEVVDMSKKLGTDHFLDRYFNGNLLDIPPTKRGNNLLRPRFKDVVGWKTGPYSGDFVIRQDTKMWGNLFSSRGYREMRLQGLIEGEKSLVKLTDQFQPRFENEVPDSFRFEYFLIWLFAFKGFPDNIVSWDLLFNFLLTQELGIDSFPPAFHERFRIFGDIPWPELDNEKQSSNIILENLAPKFKESLVSDSMVEDEIVEPELGDDDSIYSEIMASIRNQESLNFLFVGPPGTGKTHYARKIANKITSEENIIYLQFHPAISYDDFVEGFRPKYSEVNQNITYELAPRLFLEFCEKANLSNDKPHVIVIDELNRGDVQRIFGEALTYIERDYRNKIFTLPFSGKEVFIPENIIILATANPYDRSITELDDALLRRFWVINFEPDQLTLEKKLQDEGIEDSLIRKIIFVFNLINNAFPNGFGHAGFMKVKSQEDLMSIWKAKISLPLKRALLHDRSKYEETKQKIIELLTDDNFE